MGRCAVMVVAAMFCVAGCAHRQGATTRQAQAMNISKQQKNAAFKRTAVLAQSREPFSHVGKIEAGDIPTAVQVTIYQLSVPYGTVSRNEKFWKRIDETVVDINTYETLFKNGIRVGEAPTDEWDYFKHIMEENPAVTRINSLVSLDGKTVELPLRKEIQQENVFYIDSSGTHGRTYEACENLMSLVLQPAPRKRDTVRLTLCPVVRSTRKRLEYSSLNKEDAEIVYKAPEHLYELNLRADVPLNTFFVVSPSGAATWPTSVGNTFLVNDGAAERMETVLLLVPQIIKMQVGPLEEAQGGMPRDNGKAIKGR